MAINKSKNLSALSADRFFEFDGKINENLCELKPHPSF